MPFMLKEILFACGAVALSLLFIVQAAAMTDSAAMLPRLLAGLIILLSVIMVCQSVHERRRMNKAGEKENIPLIDVRRVAMFLICIVAYVVFIEFLGYFVATPLFIMGTYLFLGAMSLRNAILVTAGFCGLVYGVFVKLLHLPVPMGLLENLLGG